MLCYVTNSYSIHQHKKITGTIHIVKCSSILSDELHILTPASAVCKTHHHKITQFYGFIVFIFFFYILYVWTMLRYVVF